MTAQETFTCDGCGGTFAKGWTDAEADAEAQTVWGGVPQGAERGILCDDCWDKLPKPGVRRLKLQLYAKAAGQTVWVVVKPALHPGDPAGSISTNGPAGRDLLVFGMDADGRGAHVSRSVAARGGGRALRAHGGHRHRAGHPRPLGARVMRKAHEVSLARYARQNPRSPKIAWWAGVLARYEALKTAGQDVERPLILETRNTWIFKTTRAVDDLTADPLARRFERPLEAAGMAGRVIAADIAELYGAGAPDKVVGLRTDDLLRARQAREN
jgi:hypothetical protein